MRRLPVVAALVVLALSAISGVQAVNVFAAMSPVGGCGSSGDVATTAACYRIGSEAAMLQDKRWPRRSAAWHVACPPDGGCPFTMTFRRSGYRTIRCSGSAMVTGRSGDWRKRRVALSYRC